MAILIKYEPLPISFFGDGDWEQKANLFIEKTYFFGLFKKVVVSTYTITMFDDISSHYKHWDKLIESKTKL